MDRRESKVYYWEKGQTMTQFDKSPDRRKTNNVKWNSRAIESISANPEAQPFWVADMDFFADDALIDKAQKVASSGVYGYPVFDDLEKTFASWLERKHGWKTDPSTITYSMGLLHGIALAIDCFTKPGDRIVIPSPTYRPFRELCSLSGRIMEELELDYSDYRFSLDLGKLEEKAENASMILFCSPQNPTGIVFTEEELEGVLRIGKKYNIPVLSDEIHADLVHPGFTHIPMGKANEKVGAKTITFMAPSKTFNLAGEHSAFLIFSDSAMMKTWKDRQAALWLTTPGYFIGEMSKTAYTECDDYNRALCAYLGENAAFIDEYFMKHNCGIRKVKGGSSFVTFLDCSKVYDRIKEKVESNPERYKGGDGGGILSRFFGVEASVACNDGTWFGEQYYSFIRFNFGTNRDAIEKALERMRNAVESL